MGAGGQRAHQRPWTALGQLSAAQGFLLSLGPHDHVLSNSVLASLDSALPQPMFMVLQAIKLEEQKKIVTFSV